VVEDPAVKFASPAWLWVLAFLPIVYFLLTWDERRRKRQFGLFADPSVWSRVAPEADWGARLRKVRYWTLAMGFALLAMARPQWGSHEEVAKVSGLDIMVVLDVSNSMETEDVVPNRLKKAKHLVKSIAERLKGDRMGAVAFAGSAFLACPLTTDLDYLVDTVTILNPKMVTNQGTDIGIGLDTARRALERGAEAGEAVVPGSKSILLISDGEDHENGAVEAAGQLKKDGIKLFVVGVGTEKGGPIPVRDEGGTLMGYKRDRSNQPIVSSFRPDALTEVAGAAGGKYWNATVSEGEIEAILQEIGALNRSDYAERRYLVYEDRFQVPLLIAVLLMLLQISTPARRLTVSERQTQLGQFGKTAVTPIMLLLGFWATAAHADARKQPPLDVYLENEQGLKAYRDGKIEEAKKDFGTAQAKDPSIPELQYNRGAVQLQEGDLDGSIEAFAQAVQAAKTAPGGADEKLAGRSFFNLGSALSKKGDVNKAVQSYLGAIASAQATGDQELENDARKNIELLVQQQQQQKQKQQQDKKDQEQKDKKDQQDQKNDQSQQGSQGQNKKDQEKEQQSKYKDEPRKKFKSEKLSPEDADRVMAELAGKERELEMKLKQQHGKPTSSSQKDW
jgi:Ca-activated chloride channel family protein